jgi:hypothetical protein
MNRMEGKELGGIQIDRDETHMDAITIASKKNYLK